MEACATVQRKGQDGTWILPEMIDAYSELFNLGYAHSFEAYDEEGLAGGVYGVVLGKIFFGESMFSLRPNASKAAFIFLANYLHQNDFRWIDCQQDTPHMRSLGGYLVEENDFLNILRENQVEMLKTGTDADLG